MATYANLPVSLRVTDSLGATNTASTMLRIVNNQPVASFTASPNPAAPTQAITFDASGSYQGSPAHAIVSYEWDFNSDGVYDATGVSVSHPTGSSAATRPPCA